MSLKLTLTLTTDTTTITKEARMETVNSDCYAAEFTNALARAAEDVEKALQAIHGDVRLHEYSQGARYYRELAAITAARGE